MDEARCAHCDVPMLQELTAPHVCPDIAPYRAVAGDRMGQVIGSRKEHREFLRRNGFHEVGNEPIKDTSRPRSVIRKGEIAQELKRVIPQVRAKMKRQA
jgi:hypothetical protein